MREIATRKGIAKLDDSNTLKVLRQKANRLLKEIADKEDRIRGMEEEISELTLQREEMLRKISDCETSPIADFKDVLK